MRLLLVLIFIASVQAADNQSLQLPKKHHYHYDYHVHYCEGTDSPDQHHEQQHQEENTSKFKRRLKKARRVIVVIATCIITGVVALFERL